jgi:hypothetical protein
MANDGTKLPSKGIKSFLSRSEKKDLIQFIAATGENYERYSEYCETRGWKKFTPGYLHTWIQRHRPKIQEAREEHREEVRKTSMYDKNRRIQDLEAIADRLKKSIDKFQDDPKILVSLAEQLRKTHESIAKERGEYLKSESDFTKDVSVRDRLKQGFESMLAKAKEAEVIEGTARIVVGKD